MCSCPSGYTGKRCQNGANEDLPCDANPCKNGGQCVNIVNQIYQAAKSSKKTAKSPKTHSPGHTAHGHTGWYGSNPTYDDYMCSCRSGYNGKNCQNEIGNEE